MRTSYASRTSALGLAVLYAVTIYVVSAQTAWADGLDQWHWRNPLPTGNYLRAISFAQNRFVTVGDNGTTLASSDGINWTPGNVNPTNHLYSVAAANNLFVTVGGGGVILTSPDGVTWTPRPSGITNNLWGVASGGALWVAAGDAGALAVSTNGLDWSPRSSGVTAKLTRCAYGNGVFAVTAGASPAIPGFLTSSDGMNWGMQAIGITSLADVTFGSGVFVAGGFHYIPIQTGIFTEPLLASTNATNWGTFANPGGFVGNFRLVRFVNNQFVAAYVYVSLTPKIYVSADGMAWTILNAPGLPADPSDLAYGLGQYLLVTQGGQIWTSTNLTDWATGWTGNRNPVTSITSGNGIHIAVGSRYAPTILNESPPANTTPNVLTSTDGLAYATQTLPNGGTLASVAYGGDAFVAVGRGGTVQRTTNGTAWVLRGSGTSQDLMSVCYGNAMWVAVGLGGTISTSANGLVWSLRSSGTSYDLNSVGYGAGLFVAVGYLGTILTSPNGIDWSPQYTESIAYLQNVTYGRGLFVIVGVGGTILTSADATNWTTQVSGTSADLRSISYCNGEYLVVGTTGYYYDKNNTVLASSDAIHWSPRKVATSGRLYGCQAINGTFLVVGDDGTILQSDRIGEIGLKGRILPLTTSFELSIQGYAGLSYRLQAAGDIPEATWEDIVSFTNTQPIERWVDTNALVRPKRFYRVRSP